MVRDRQFGLALPTTFSSITGEGIFPLESIGSAGGGEFGVYQKSIGPFRLDTPDSRGMGETHDPSRPMYHMNESTEPRRSPLVQLDHILTADIPRGATYTGRALELPVSDHRAVCAELNW